MTERSTEVLVIGGGLGGVGAALAALTLGRKVILTEESPWLGGQVTSQAVPPDEYPWIEKESPSRLYRRFRNGVRSYYRRTYPLNEDARTNDLLNPGGGGVSPICHEPRVAVAVIDELLAPYRSDGQLLVLLDHEPVAAEADGDQVTSVRVRSSRTGSESTLTAPYVIDATETGDLLDLAGVEHVYGAESRDDTGELHAVDGPAQPLNQQSFTWCFAVDYDPDGDHTIDKPADYDYWRSYRPEFWPGPLLGWEDVEPHTLAPRKRAIFEDPDSWRGAVTRDFWHYRRIFASRNHEEGRYRGDVTLVNWPQIDYMDGPILGVDQETVDRHLAGSRAQSLAFLYWMQTEAPRLDGGTGYRGLRPRGDLLGSDDHLALRPYIRESRRIKAEFTVLEQHLGVEAREAAGLPDGSEIFPDTVGVGSYRIDLHPSTGSGAGPRNYIDVSNYPFQIPLGALIPQRVDNLLPGNKNIGSTHITNGCYRLHPVEWVIGEAAGALAAHALDTGQTPRAIRNDPSRLADFQRLLATTLDTRLAWTDQVRATRR
ncbi:FAD-dependent oxidoreductase [Microlunatus sp. GCM10028923]|uniref:FAD-dependent oxidoreductase n=1 Tax=Microlunatus sp. GCM10028923 TaxID=3273400 RepID=UPI003614AD21